MTVLNNYHQFIEKVLTDIDTFGIDVSNLNMDHIGYQASSGEDYEHLKTEFDQIGTLMSEKIVGGRRVGIYRFHEPLRYKQYINTAIELIEPKPDQICPSALEHVEFVIDNFESFMHQYPEVTWDTSAITQPDFPMIKLKLSGSTQVKFHLTPVLEIIT